VRSVCVAKLHVTVNYIKIFSTILVLKIFSAFVTNVECLMLH
jgi:hypothetical protein